MVGHRVAFKFSKRTLRIRCWVLISPALCVCVRVCVVGKCWIDVRPMYMLANLYSGHEDWKLARGCLRKEYYSLFGKALEMGHVILMFVMHED